MNIDFFILSQFVIFIFSDIVVGIIRRYCINSSLLDIPNARSSHSVPTPRGGGAAIALVVILSMIISYVLNLMRIEYFLALSVGGIFVALIGWVDDRFNLKAIVRLVAYLIASCWAILWMGELNEIHFGSNFILILGNAGFFIGVLWVLWLTNLYNFMDGTDAIAGVQALCTGLFAAFIFWLEEEYGVSYVCITVSVASAAFLFWNRPPAKIFMGDVGSCFLGFIFSCMAIIGEITEIMPIIVWIILLSIFFFDSTFTLFKRIYKKEKWYNAHREHAYQRLVQMGMSHGKLALSILLINIIILWPIAYIAYMLPDYSFILFITVIIFMFILWVFIQSGKIQNMN